VWVPRSTRKLSLDLSRNGARVTSGTRAGVTTGTLGIATTTGVAPDPSSADPDGTTPVRADPDGMTPTIMAGAAELAEREHPLPMAGGCFLISPR
jgi:hypothetical protein